MKRPWAVILAATALVGCRSSQPATNPFLQTTVPPPATGAPVVLPGEQFSPGVVPQPAVAPVPQVITPAVPIAPPPPVVAPPKDKFDPPGGSFQYNQSSLERTQPGAAGGVVLASHQEPLAQPAAAQPPITPATVATPTPAALSESADVAQSPASPVRPTTTIRILPPKSSSSTEPQPVAATEMEPERESSNPVLRLTVGDDRKQAETEDDLAAEGSRAVPLASVSKAADRDDPADEDPQDESVAATAEPVDVAAAENAGYAYAPDYGWLRGRLEYSQSMRQWKLRYIPIDGKTDQFGGSVKLPASNELAAYKAGDMVAVRGSLARETSASGSFAPRYDLCHIEPVVR